MKKFLLVVLLLVLLAGGYVAWQAWRTIYGPANGPSEQVVLVPREDVARNVQVCQRCGAAAHARQRGGGR